MQAVEPPKSCSGETDELMASSSSGGGQLASGNTVPSGADAGSMKAFKVLRLLRLAKLLRLSKLTKMIKRCGNTIFTRPAAAYQHPVLDLASKCSGLIFWLRA